MSLEARFNNIVDEVDFAAFLVFGGAAFEDGGDADGIVPGPEEGLHNGLGGLMPSGEGSAVGVCIWEEDDLVVG